MLQPLGERPMLFPQVASVPHDTPVTNRLIKTRRPRLPNFGLVWHPAKGATTFPNDKLLPLEPLCFGRRIHGGRRLGYHPETNTMST
jgi:hypothetical protein